MFFKGCGQLPDFFQFVCSPEKQIGGIGTSASAAPRSAKNLLTVTFYPDAVFHDFMISWHGVTDQCFVLPSRKMTLTFMVTF